MKTFDKMNTTSTIFEKPVLRKRCFRTVEAVLLLSGKEPSNKRKGCFC